MIDIGKSQLNITCRRCDFKNLVFLKQVKLKDVVICRGCKTDLQLSDYMNSYIRAERNIRLQINQLLESLKELGNLTNKK